MKFLDNLIARFRKKTDTHNDEVKRNTLDLGRKIGMFDLGAYRPSLEEREFNQRAVVGAKLSKKLPLGSTMFRCRQGFYIKRYGHTPYSGHAPSQKAAQKAALRNLGL
jgi:hypothetical protein